MKKRASPLSGLALFFAGRNNRPSQITVPKGRKVLLTDNEQRVAVTLKLDDWAKVMFALATADIPDAAKRRINDEVFRCARRTVRAS